MNIFPNPLYRSILAQDIEEMEKLVLDTNCFIKAHPNNTRFIDNNPFKIKTEREDYAIRRDLPVYRILFERNLVKCPSL